MAGVHYGGDEALEARVDELEANIGGSGIPLVQKGAPDGVATLDGDGLVPAEQLPPPVESGSGLPSTIRNKTANYTAVDGDLILCDATGGAFTITLPASGTAIIVKTDASANAVAVAGTVNGDAGGASLDEQDAGGIFKSIATDAWRIVALTATAGASTAALDAHIADAVAAHAASAVSFTPTGTIAATDVQTAVAEVAMDAASALTTHTGAADPHGDRAYSDGLFAANDALVYKGAIDASANPNYPAASAGHAYKISVAGKIGGASGTNVEVNDLAICTVDGTSAGTQAAVGASWSIIQANLDGAVIGPASAVSGQLVSFSGTGGKLVADSGLALDTDTALAANSDAKIPSQKAVKAHVAGVKGLPLALTGATAATRFVGGTASGAPASGTFAVGDFIIDQTAKVYICTVAGSPGTWVQVGAGGGGGVPVDVQVFNAAVGTQTWTKPTAGQLMGSILGLGAGGGAGSGRRGAAGTLRNGGAGGGGGEACMRIVRLSLLSATETLQVALGGAGGAAVTADDTDGNAGTVALATYFKSQAWWEEFPARGGPAGTGSTTVLSAVGGFANGMVGSAGGGATSGAGANGTDQTTAATGQAFGGARSGLGGGGGGGITAANASGGGGRGGAVQGPTGAFVVGVGNNGAANGGNGTAGTALGSDNGGQGGGGGGGGNPAGGAGGTGGAGAFPAGGGGGGGGSLNGSNSGAGGAGGNGLIVVVCW